MKQLTALKSSVNRFLTKASKKNEPLEAFRATDSFKNFQEKLVSAIQKQAKWLSKNLDDFGDLYNEDLADSEFEAKFGAWLKNEMPGISTYISEDDIYDYLLTAFIWSVEAQYARLDIRVNKSGLKFSWSIESNNRIINLPLYKASGFVDFALTNSYYIAALKDQANYLLHKSNIDETTRSRMINLIRDSRLELDTLEELSNMIVTEFEGISDNRAYLIANTETNQAMSTAQQAFLTENGFKTKQWVGAGPNTCPICQGNEDDGPVQIDQSFSSGDDHPPAHPGCECYEDAAEEIDLNTIPILWAGD